MAKYLKINSKKGYIEDTAMIAHEKFNNMRRVVLGCMLGDFDNNGEYFVHPQIVEELIKMDKHIVETIDNIDLCESFLKLDKPITFAITFQNDKATLSLLEKIGYGANFKLNSGAYSDVNEYILAEIETSGAIDKNAVYRMWNVKMGGGEALDVFHMDPETLARLSGIVGRFKYLLAANKKLLKKEERIEEIEAAYFNKMMRILDRYPKLKAAVEKEIKNQLDEKTGMLRLDKPNLMKTMNEIVADAIEDNIDVLTEEEQKKFNAERHNVENEYNIEITKEVDIKTEKVEQKDLNADPIIVPKIETFGEEDRKSIEDLAKEFVEEEKKVEERVQNDIVTLATAKVPEKKVEKEESKNLIIESIKGETKQAEETKADDTKKVEVTAFQSAVLDEANKVKKPTHNEKLDAVKGIIAIATETEKEKIVVTNKGLAAVTEKEKKLLVAEVKDGKVTSAVTVSQKKTDAFIKKTTGEEVAAKIEEVKVQVVDPKKEEVSAEKTNEKVTGKNNTNSLVAAVGNAEKKVANAKTTQKGGAKTSTTTKKGGKVQTQVEKGQNTTKTKEESTFYYVGNSGPITPKEQPKNREQKPEEVKPKIQISLLNRKEYKENENKDNPLVDEISSNNKLKLKAGKGDNLKITNQVKNNVEVSGEKVSVTGEPVEIKADKTPEHTLGA